MASKFLQSQIEMQKTSPTPASKTYIPAEHVTKPSNNTRHGVDRNVFDEGIRAAYANRTQNKAAPEKKISPLERAGLTVKGSLEDVGAGALNASRTTTQFLANKLADAFGWQDHLKASEARGQDVLQWPEKLRAAAESDIQKAKQGTGKAGSFAIDVINTGANLGANAAFAYTTGMPFLTAIGTTSGGSSALDAKEQGKTLDQQFNYGLTSGLSEAAIESVGGIGASKVAKGVVSHGVSVLLSKLPSGVATWLSKAGASTAGKILGDAISEASEEFVQYDVDRVLQKITLGNNVPRDIKQQAYQALIGGVTGGVFGGGKAVIDARARATPPNASTAEQAAPEVTQAAPQVQGPVENTTVPESHISMERAKAEVTKPASEDQIHIDDRTYEDVSSRKVKAFQFDHPELHKYYVEAAKAIQYDLANSVKGERFYNNVDYENVFTGTTRYTTSPVERLLDNAKLTYAQINKALDDIIADHGQENYAAAKKVELVLDDVLTNGYQDIDGISFDPDENYIGAKGRINGSFSTDSTEYRMSEEEWASILADNYQGQDNPQTHSVRENNASGMGAAKAGFDKIGALVNKYGAIPQGMNPAADRVVEIPTQTKPDNKVSRAARSLAESKVTPQEFVPTIEEYVVDGRASYIPITNSDTEIKATAKIKADGFPNALADWSEKVGQGQTSADIVATGAVLYNNAVNSGDGKTAMNILSNYIKLTRNTAQALQAARMIKTLTPSGKLYMVQKTVENMGEKLGFNVGIDPALTDEYSQAPDDAARDAVIDKIYQNIADQVPASKLDKWNAWRYLAMLGNFKTQVRNVVGNVGFQPARIVKDKIGALLETVANAATHGKVQRTKSFAADPNLFKAALADFPNVQREAMGAGKFSDPIKGISQEIESRRTIFKTKWIEAYRQATNKAMDVGDVFFNRLTYADALAGYLKANGITAEQLTTGEIDTALLDKARAYAIKEAQKATYRDKNQFSDWVSGLGKNYTGKNLFAKGANLIVEGVLPFKRTPANILTRAEEYSPFGFVNTVVEAAKAKKGESDATVVIDKAASAITGTGLLTIGAYLFTNGVVTGGKGQDDDQARFDALQGKQKYSMILPDGTSVTLDWLAPESMPFFIGVELAKNAAENGFSLSDISAAGRSIIEPLLEMSMVQGVNNALDSVTYSENKLIALVTQALLGYVSQAIPTISGQAERTFENQRMSTFVDKNSPFSSTTQYILGRTSAKIPGLDYNQIPYIDAWGRTQAGSGALENFFSPAYTSKNRTTATDRELQRLYDATGASVLPSNAPKYFTLNNKQYDMTADEYVKFAKTRGQYAFSELTKVINSVAYKNAPDLGTDGVKGKDDMVSAVYKTANQKAQKELVEGRGGMYLDADGAKKVQTLSSASGISEKEAYAVYQALDVLKPERGKTSVSDVQRTNAILGHPRINQEKKVKLISSVLSDSSRENLLGTVNKSENLLNLYKNTGDLSVLTSYMSVPSSFQSNKMEYTLTDREKNIYRKTYLSVFNSGVSSVFTPLLPNVQAIMLTDLKKDAHNAAKQAIIQSR